MSAKKSEPQPAAHVPAPTLVPRLPLSHNLFNAAILVAVALPALLVGVLTCTNWAVWVAQLAALHPALGWLMSPPVQQGLAWVSSFGRTTHPLVVVNVLLLLNVDVLFYIVSRIQGNTWLIDPYWCVSSNPGGPMQGTKLRNPLPSHSTTVVQLSRVIIDTAHHGTLAHVCQAVCMVETAAHMPTCSRPHRTVIPLMIQLFYANHPDAVSDPARARAAQWLTWVWSTRLTWSYFRREEWQFGAREDWWVDAVWCGCGQGGRLHS